MKTEPHKAPPEVIHALVTKLETLDAEQASVISSLIDLVRAKKITLPSYGEWTDDEITQASMESLWKIWDNDEDAIYDKL